MGLLPSAEHPFALCSKSWCISLTSTVLLGPRLAEPSGRFFFRKVGQCSKGGRRQSGRASLHSGCGNEVIRWAAGRSGQVSEQLTQWADQFLLQERRATESVPAPPPPRAPGDQSERIAPLPLNTVAVWRLTCCKRVGDPLLSFIRLILPKLVDELRDILLLSVLLRRVGRVVDDAGSLAAHVHRLKSNRRSSR